MSKMMERIEEEERKNPFLFLSFFFLSLSRFISFFFFFCLLGLFFLLARFVERSRVMCVCARTIRQRRTTHDLVCVYVSFFCPLRMIYILFFHGRTRIFQVECFIDIPFAHSQQDINDRKQIDRLFSVINRLFLRTFLFVDNVLVVVIVVFFLNRYILESTQEINQSINERIHLCSLATAVLEAQLELIH